MMATKAKKKKQKKIRRKLTTAERGRRISLGRLNSPKIKAQKEVTKRRRELKLQMQRQRRLEEIAKWGSYFSPETRAKLSQLRKGCTPWNKGVTAWNNGVKWPNEVKENISKGMIVYWIQRKEDKEMEEQLLTIK